MSEARIMIFAEKRSPEILRFTNAGAAAYARDLLLKQLGIQQVFYVGGDGIAQVGLGNTLSGASHDPSSMDWDRY